jgi:DNA-binding beta-propeller fold protein YncE
VSRLLPLLLVFLIGSPAGAGFESVRTFLAGPEGPVRPSPLGISVGHNGLLYVADGANSRVAVFDSTGTLRSTIGFAGAEEGRFLQPTDVAAAEGLHLYVLDSGNERIQLFDRFEQFLRVLVSREEGTIGIPLGIEADPFGRLYVTDAEEDRVRVFRSFTGEEEFSFGGYGAGPGRFRGPADVAVDRMRRIYVCDRENRRVQVFGALADPAGVAVDRLGRVFVADATDRRVAAFGEDGRLLAEFRGGPGAPFGSPRGVATDGKGGLYVSDASTGLVHVLRYGFPADAP